jgi:putative FmdB family regulatory protein
MPIYEYKCIKCDKVFERIVSVADSSKTVFCDCSPNAKAKKIISAPSFRLEGSGWYETDFKTGNKKNLVQSEDKSKKTTKESKKTDNSKTAKKD